MESAAILIHNAPVCEIFAFCVLGNVVGSGQKFVWVHREILNHDYRKNKLVPLLCLRPSLEGPSNFKTFGDKDVSKCHNVTHQFFS
jgi:hypothetical protein